MPNFAAAFAAARGAPIEYEGRTLRAAFRLAAAPGDRLRLRFERSRERPVQGLRVAAPARGARLEIAGQVGSQFVLWADTAPPDVAVLVHDPGAGGEVALFNVWRDEKYGTTLYGLNAAAIDAREEPDGSVLLMCSDGWGDEPDFDDLVVRVVRERGARTG